MRKRSGMGKFTFQWRQLLLSLSCCCLASFLPVSNAETVSSGGRPDRADDTQASDAVRTYAPREHSILSVQANLGANGHGPMINDTNFKTLVHHCLKSHDETACDGMKSWDVSRVTDCSLLFWEPTHNADNDWVLLRGADTFNVDISGWNTSACTTMRSMFNGAIAFDQPIGNWNVQRVTDMSHMFQGARIFNKDLKRWNTGNVLDMSHMFRYASRFHANDLSHWDTARVTNMAHMFDSASHFNGKLNWNVARVQHFSNMFHNADMFNAGGIADWDVSGAIDMPEQELYGFVSMFDGARDFNQDVSHWDMRHAIKLDYMFRDAYSFDQDLSPWDVQQVDDMADMFHHAKSFSQTLCWDLSGKTLGNIFEGTMGGSADSNTPRCWESKHKDKKEHDNENGEEVDFNNTPNRPTEQPAQAVTSNTTKRTRPVPSMGTRFLQAFLFAAVVALASYWVLMIRRYIRKQKTKQVLERRVVERANRGRGGGHGGSSRRISAVPGGSIGETEEEEEEDDKDDDDGGQGGNNSLVGGENDHHILMTESDLKYSTDEDDEEEIMFQCPADIEALRRQCFAQQFVDPALLFGTGDNNNGTDNDNHNENAQKISVEHAVPAMNVLLQQEEYLRQLRETRRAKRAKSSRYANSPNRKSKKILEALGNNASKLTVDMNHSNNNNNGSRTPYQVQQRPNSTSQRHQQQSLTISPPSRQQQQEPSSATELFGGVAFAAAEPPTTTASATSAATTKHHSMSVLDHLLQQEQEQEQEQQHASRREGAKLVPPPSPATPKPNLSNEDARVAALRLMHGGGDFV